MPGSKRSHGRRCQRRGWCRDRRGMVGAGDHLGRSARLGRPRPDWCAMSTPTESAEHPRTLLHQLRQVPAPAKIEGKTIAGHWAGGVGQTVVGGFIRRWSPDRTFIVETTARSAAGGIVCPVSVRMSAGRDGHQATRKSAHCAAPCAATPPRRDQQPIAGHQSRSPRCHCNVATCASVIHLPAAPLSNMIKFT
jgi:hypothetical protein